MLNEVMSSRNTTDEQWRDVFGYEGLYQVSDKGRVRSVDREVVVRRSDGNEFTKKMPGKMRSLNNCGGSNQVMLSKGGGRKVHQVHHLVARAFIPNPEGYESVRRIDDDRGDEASNLQWCSHADVLSDVIDSDWTPLSPKQVESIHESRNVYKMSYREIAAKFDISMDRVMNVLLGNTYKQFQPKR